jgi:hypothetical protein
MRILEANLHDEELDKTITGLRVIRENQRPQTGQLCSRDASKEGRRFELLELFGNRLFQGQAVKVVSCVRCDPAAHPL